MIPPRIVPPSFLRTQKNPIPIFSIQQVPSSPNSFVQSSSVLALSLPFMPIPPRPSPTKQAGPSTSVSLRVGPIVSTIMQMNLAKPVLTAMGVTKPAGFQPRLGAWDGESCSLRWRQCALYSFAFFSLSTPIGVLGRMRERKFL